MLGVNAEVKKFKTVNIPIESGIDIIDYYKKYIVQAYQSIG